VTRLTILTGPDRDRSVEPRGGEPVVLGRESSDIVLRDPAVSRRHAELYFDNGRWMVRDLESSNGTFVNGQKITGPVELHNNDQIRCGTTVVLFESTEAPRRPAGAPEPVVSAAVDEGGETLVGSTLDVLVSKASARRYRRAAQAGLAALNRSHGIKNLLQTLASSREVVDYAFRIGDVDRAKRGWKVLNSNLDQIGRLILDLLKFSRESKPNLAGCSPNALMVQVVETARHRANEKGVVIGLHTDAAVKTAILDADRIAEAVLNLILNAIDAVDADKGKIEVATRADEANGQIVIEVGDNGCGIKDTQIIFEPFHTTDLKKGTGLGLPIARKIIEEHGGRIDVESTPGRGTTFTIRLPIHSNPPDEKK